MVPLLADCGWVFRGGCICVGLVFDFSATPGSEDEQGSEGQTAWVRETLRTKARRREV